MLPFLLLSAAVPPASASLLGDWITPNKSVVEVYRCSSAVCIRIAHIDPSIPETTDGKNPESSLRSRPLCGLVIGTGFTLQDDAHAEGGKLYDPESGHTYSGTLTLADSSTLKLHGFIGVSLFGRTENWHRTGTAQPACK